MNHSSSRGGRSLSPAPDRNRNVSRLIATCLAFFAVPAAFAQPTLTPAAAQQRYEREMAGCNSGALAAPAREACLRAAGVELDAARGGPPSDVAVPSADGRATVISPAGSTTPSGGSDATTSRDGRATIVLPADRTAPR
ncbi:conserved exported hypothetical protein [Burkholderiales bacterium 8X]|nr:conserved exported hypothetical protein [Burkholderiales bacterium 8X]